MSELPSVSKGSVFVAKRYFGIFSVLAIILAVLFLAFWFSKKDLRDGFIESFEQSTKEADFGGADRKDKYFSNFGISATAEGKPNKFDPLSQNFVYLASAYKATHDPFYRIKALELAGYLKENYREESSNVNFELECLDSSCSKIQYPDELKAVLTLIDSAKFPEDSDYRSFIKRSLESAEIKTDKSEKFNAYFSAYQYLWLAYQKKQDADVKSAGEKLLIFINQNYYQELTRIKEIDGEAKFVFK